MKISEALKRFRNEFDLTQKEAARRISIVPQQWQKYEYDQISPSAELIVKIATAFGVSADYLLGLSNSPKPNEVDAKFFARVETCAKNLLAVLESEANNRGRVQDNESS